MSEIRQILMGRDGMSYREAETLINKAQIDLNDRFSQGEMPDDICEDWFGLESDYIMDLL